MATYNGTANAETITGSTSADSIIGAGGFDTLYGLDGNDTIWGDASGSDVAGDPADVIDGGAGADALHGGGGDDTIAGGAGNDSLCAESGQDTADYRTSTGNVVIKYTAAAGAEYTATSDGLGGSDSMNGMDDFWGGSGNDTIDTAGSAWLHRVEGTSVSVRPDRG